MYSNDSLLSFCPIAAKPAQRVFRIKMLFPSDVLCNEAGQGVLRQRVKNAVNSLNRDWNFCSYSTEGSRFVLHTLNCLGRLENWKDFGTILENARTFKSTSTVTITVAAIRIARRDKVNSHPTMEALMCWTLQFRLKSKLNLRVFFGEIEFYLSGEQANEMYNPTGLTRNRKKLRLVSWFTFRGEL